MRKRMNRPKKMDPPKRTDPPKGVVGEGHLVIPSIGISIADPPEGGGRGNMVLPAVRSAGVESVADESNWAMHELPPGKSVGVGTGTHPDHLRAERITVGTAKRIIGPAHWALQSLATPNDLKEEHRDLFLDLVRTVAELQQKLAAIEEENRRLADENEDLCNSIDQALPLWKRAFEEFVLKLAGDLGTLAAGGTAFVAGFIAGMLYNTLSPGEPGLSI